MPQVRVLAAEPERGGGLLLRVETGRQVEGRHGPRCAGRAAQPARASGVRRALDSTCRAQVTTASLDPFRVYSTALPTSLPDEVRVLDAIHVVHLGQAAVDGVRRRLRGMKKVRDMRKDDRRVNSRTVRGPGGVVLTHAVGHRAGAPDEPGLDAVCLGGAPSVRERPFCWSGAPGPSGTLIGYLSGKRARSVPGVIRRAEE